MTPFEQSFALTVGDEGDFSNETNDRGNWTSGIVGVGVLGGTKYGIASHVYADNLSRLPSSVRSNFPSLVRDLTIDQARVYYEALYWEPAACDHLPAPLAFLVFDAAVNGGVGGAIILLQKAVEVKADGAFGSFTLAAVQSFLKSEGLSRLCQEFIARRIVFLASTAIWQNDSLGLARRLAAQSYHAASMESGS